MTEAELLHINALLFNITLDILIYTHARSLNILTATRTDSSPFQISLEDNGVQKNKETSGVKYTVVKSRSERANSSLHAPVFQVL